MVVGRAAALRGVRSVMAGRATDIVAVAVGNTRTRVARCGGNEVHDPVSVANADPGSVANAVLAACENVHGAPIVVSSVVPDLGERLRRVLAEQHGLEVLRIGHDVAVPIRVALDDASTVGQDRLLCALAAFHHAEQACVVVDAGTAITVDFVDGEGVFQGGVIAPGLALMLRSLRQGTAQLPEIVYSAPDPARGPFGKDTAHAMVLGVRAAARGLVRETVERYAEHYQAYPQIVATGGDARALFEDDDLVEHIVPDLQLMGIARAYRHEAEQGETDDDGDDDA